MHDVNKNRAVRSKLKARNAMPGGKMGYGETDAEFVQTQSNSQGATEMRNPMGLTYSRQNIFSAGLVAKKFFYVILRHDPTFSLFH